MKQQRKRFTVLAMSIVIALSLTGLSAVARSDVGEPPSGGDMPGDGIPSGDMPDGGMSGGGMSGGDMPPGAAASEMPDSADQYFANENDDVAVEDGYCFVSPDYGVNAIAATDCSSVTVGGETDCYDADGILAAVTDENMKATTEKYVGEYLGDGSVNSFIILGAEEGADSTPGNAISVDSGILYATNLYIQTSGAISAAVSGRYGLAAMSGAIAVVNDSYVIHTGATEATDDVEEPGSNGGLLISGRGRANFSVGSSSTMYFNSTVVTEGWAAMSTDSASGSGLYFYSYNSKARAENGGYGVYADSGCNAFLYATELSAAEIGIIISNDGAVEVGSGDDARDVTVANTGETLLSYNTGEESSDGSVIAGGRNSVMLHSPSSNGYDEDMNHYSLTISDSALVTSEDLVGETSDDRLSSYRDYGEYYGEATGRWIDLVAGANLLVKSTYGTITLDNVTAESYSGVLLTTIPNSDSSSRYITAGNEGGDTTLNISDSTIEGDIWQYDYQRDLNATITDSTYSGAVARMTAETWAEMWADVADDDDCYWGSLNNDSYNTETHDANITLERSTWIVTDTSSVSSLTIDGDSSVAAPDGCSLTMTVDGVETAIEPGNYEGDIVLNLSGSTGSLLSGASDGTAAGISTGIVAVIVVVVIAVVVVCVVLVVRRRNRG